ncbi:hypothetical protein APHAL10511_008434 [Amanita phalloides]|nr:hypothetical protein APHAL10511_008434 [Amanita phalloides]
MLRSRLAVASPKPILKRAIRPAPLPIARSPRSPHVHFPLSPGLFSTFSTHSPSTYDRSPYPLSPSSLSITSTFKLADPPKRNLAARPPAPVLEENDPRSPRPAGALSFAAAATALSHGSQVRTELNAALKGFPRSPYPSAPLSAEAPELDTKSRARSNSADGVRSVAPRRPPPLVIANHDRVGIAGGATGTGRDTITFQLTSSRRLAPPHLDLTAAKMPPYLTPVQESASSAGIETELDVDKVSSDISSGGDSTRLSNAFWRSVSFQLEPGQEGALAPLAGNASVSDGGFPESVTGSQPSVASDPDLGGLTLRMSPRPKIPQFEHTSRGARVPSLLFGRSDGSVWSPGPISSMSPGLTSPAPWSMAGLASPRAGTRKNSSLAVPRSVVAAPSPNDPFAKFPSFAAVLEMDVPKAPKLGIKPPPRAHLPYEH